MSDRDGYPEILTNSRDVTAFFGMQHGDILRAIVAMLGSDSEVSSSTNQWLNQNFHPVMFADAQGRMHSSYDMTRDGFLFLAMGFGGLKALELKINYLAAFDAREHGV